MQILRGLIIICLAMGSFLISSSFDVSAYMIRTRTFLVLLAHIGLIAVLNYTLSSSRLEPVPMDPLGSVKASVPEPPGLSGARLHQTQEAIPRESAGTPELEEPVQAAVKQACIVIGVVCDEHQAPLEGVEVKLAAYQFWAEGLDLPRLQGRYDMRGFLAQTASDGAFRFEVPAPTNDRVTLSIEPGRFLDSYKVDFGNEARSQQPVLLPGLHDLGVIVLPATGALRGRVTDEGGQVIEDARLTVAAMAGTTLGRYAWTDSNGEFVLGHAPIGTYGVSIRRDGYLRQFREPFVVEAGVDTQPVDFVLIAAQTLEGSVVDEEGQPIAGAKLWGRPESSGAGAGARSDEKGRFAISLPQDEPYSLAVSLDGYLTWGSAHDKTKTYAPGTRGLKIVMRTQAPIRFLVIDAVTDDAVSRYGIKILENNGSKSPRRVMNGHRRPAFSEHPDGIATTYARPGIDQYLIAAKGYVLAVADVKEDEPGGGLQTVHLKHGAQVHGRVVRGGQPVALAPVDIVSGSRIGTWSVDGKVAWKFYVDRDTKQSTTTDGEGLFSFIALPLGDFRLTVRPKELPPLRMQLEDLEQTEHRQLGDLVLLDAATVEGIVLVPPEINAAGLQVFVDDLKDSDLALVDAFGRFRIEGLAPGEHTLTLKGRPGRLAQGNPVSVELFPGTVHDVTLDARDSIMGHVRLTIRSNELDISGARVSLRQVGDLARHEDLGICDDQGQVNGFISAKEEWRVHVRFVVGEYSRNVVHPVVRVQTTALGEAEMEVQFDFARLGIQVPAGITIPLDGRAEVILTPTDPTQSIQEIKVQFKDGLPTRAGESLMRVENSVIHCGGVLAGSRSVTLRLIAKDAKSVVVVGDDESWTITREAYYESTSSVNLAPGQALILNMP